MNISSLFYKHEKANLVEKFYTQAIITNIMLSYHKISDNNCIYKVENLIFL